MSLLEKLKRWATRHWIRWGRVPFVAYSADELQDILTQQLPHTVTLQIPMGIGRLHISSGTLQLVSAAELPGSLQVELLCDLHIHMMGNPVYRAHVLAQIAAVPVYDHKRHRVNLSQSTLINLRYIKDEYALMEDGKTLLKQLLPAGIGGLLGSTLSQTLNLMPGQPQAALKTYANLFASGSKQRVLDYHRPQLQQQLDTLSRSGELSYCLDPNDWEDALFIEFGKRVAVADGELRCFFVQSRE